MNNYQADPIQDIINIVNRIGGITDFLSIYPMDKGLEEFYKDLLQFTSSSDSGLNESEKQLFSDLEIAIHLYLEKFETNCLYYVNNDKMLDEGDLDEFRHDWEQSKTGKETFKESSIRRYKTYTDFYKYELHDSDLILSKYQDAVHPLINAMIAESLMNGGYYQDALSFLANGLNYSLRYPHLYWHNKFGMIGCVKNLWILLLMITYRKNYRASSQNEYYWERIEYKVNEILYMSLTRAIDMAPDLAQTCDLLSNRAELFWVKHNGAISMPRRNMGMAIFANAGFPMATMEVQYLADKKYAFERACRINSSLGGVFCEKLNESSMMYRYGDSRPNLSDITPMSINDDVSYDDLKVMAIHRADAVACKIYKNFSNHVLEFSSPEIQELIINLREVYYNISPKDDFFEIFNALEQVFNKKHYVRIADLLTCMKTIEPKCGKYECFNHILQNIQNCNMDYVGKGLLDSILENYRKIERNFNWGTEENTTITDIFKNDGKKEYHDIGIDETDASASYDDQGNLFK